jgi:hypothetical protein
MQNSKYKAGQNYHRAVRASVERASILYPSAAGPVTRRTVNVQLLPGLRGNESRAVLTARTILSPAPVLPPG